MENTRRFDTNVQYLKYKVLKEVAALAFEDRLLEHIWDIPKLISPGTKPTMRCCVYKERAIGAERVKLAMGGEKSNPNIIEVIDIACDECPVGGHTVTDTCRGCIAHRCESACPKGAITFDEHQKACIDKTKCVECGQCAKVCPYNAIVKRKRPCENACKVKAIGMGENMAAKIDNDKCINCGACVYQCPFGAITDSSYILNVIDFIKKSKGNTVYKMYAVVAPAIAAQFDYATTGQLVTGIKTLGFDVVVEAAMGADMVTLKEAEELKEKGFLTSSCCPAFVAYIEKNFPKLADNISHNFSPMVETAKHIKEGDPTAKVVFIGPCTAKKAEYLKPEVAPYVDSVITFEELQALLDSRNIEITVLSETPLNDASPYGRIFARSGGLSEAVAQGYKELGLDDTELKPVVCDGIEACRVALLKASKGVLDGNFIEGMACTGGCVGGAGCLTHGDKQKRVIDDFSTTAEKRTIK